MARISAVNMAKFYKGFPTQVGALEYLDTLLVELLTDEQWNILEGKWRAPYEKPKPSEEYIYACWSGQYDEYRNKIFGMYLIAEDKVVDKIACTSGQSYAQDVVWPLDDYSGSMRPLPEGIYDIGPLDDLGYDPGSSDGFGQWVYSLTPRAAITRSALLVHCDRNRNTSPGCFDIEETEVLTTQGFISAKDITLEHKVFQMGDNFELVTGNPLKIIREEYEGEMILVTTNKLSMLVTPNHRIAKTSVHKLKPWADKKPRISYFSAEDLKSNPSSFSVPTSGVYGAEKEVNEETILFERLHMAFLADGYHQQAQTMWHFRKERKIHRLEKLLQDMGIEYKVLPRKDGSVAIATQKLPFEKDISPEYALTLPLELKLEMLKELIHWDGSTSSGKSKSGKYCCHVGTTKKNQAEFYRLLAITSGWGCKVTEWTDERNSDWSLLYRCNIVEGRIRYGIETPEQLGSLDITTLNDYIGTVFCLETETTNFVVKHRGEVFITGNSAGCLCPYSIETMLKFVTWQKREGKPRKLVMDHKLGFLKEKEGFTAPDVAKKPESPVKIPESAGDEVVTKDVATAIVSKAAAEHIFRNTLTDVQLQDLNKCMEMFEINTPQRKRHFLSQCCHESAGLQYMKEIGDHDYFTQNYEDRTELGNIYPGDGAKFAGVGPIQTTGRSNYARLAKVVGDPKILELGQDYTAKHWAFIASGVWWDDNRMNELCDSPDVTVEKVSRMVNCGGNPKYKINGLPERIECYKRACEVI